MSGARELSDYEQTVLDNVARTGCHWTMVFDPDGARPSFGYSVGFPETVDQPDVIVFGLSQEVMGHIINETLRKCRDGFRLSDGARIDGLLSGHICIARSVAPEFVLPDYFNSAMWYLRRQTGKPMTEAFQIVWPGAQDGLFPWDADCSDIVKEYQPALYHRELNS